MKQFTLTTIVTACLTSHALADGNAVDKVYDPYVQPLEREIEWRAIYQRDDKHPNNQQQLHRLGLGASLNDSWFAEIYLLGEKNAGDEGDLAGAEIELKHQLTEQGQYSADWGLLFELEQLREDDSWEAATTLISARDVRRWTFTANLSLIYEWGQHVQDELETALALQARYRYKAAFSPAIEFYAGQDSYNLGPVAVGSYSIAAGRKLFWEVGWLLDIGSDAPQQTFRAQLEYEF